MKLICFSSIKSVFRVVGQAVDSELEEEKEVVEDMDGKFHMSFGALGSTQTLDPTDSTDELIQIWDSFFTGFKVSCSSTRSSGKPSTKQSGSGCQVQLFQCLPSPVSRPSLLKL